MAYRNTGTLQAQSITAPPQIQTPIRVASKARKEYGFARRREIMRLFIASTLPSPRLPGGGARSGEGTNRDRETSVPEFPSTIPDGQRGSKSPGISGRRLVGPES